jgi:hypothetical protein
MKCPECNKVIGFGEWFKYGYRCKKCGLAERKKYEETRCLTEEETLKLAAKSSIKDIKKLIEEQDAYYKDALILCEKLTNATIADRKEFIAFAIVMDVAYGKEAKEELIRVLHLKKERFSEGKSAVEAVRKHFDARKIPWTKKERLKYFLTLFYAFCKARGADKAEEHFLELAEQNESHVEHIKSRFEDFLKHTKGK